MWMVSASVKRSHSPRAWRGAGGDGVVLAGPAFEQRVGFDDSHSGERRGDCAGVVGGMVVDDDDFEGDSGLRDEGLETVGQAGFFVARGNDDRDCGGVGSVVDIENEISETSGLKPSIKLLFYRSAESAAPPSSGF